MEEDIADVAALVVMAEFADAVTCARRFGDMVRVFDSCRTTPSTTPSKMPMAMRANVERENMITRYCSTRVFAV
jgi:hypothetical protein